MFLCFSRFKTLLYGSVLSCWCRVLEGVGTGSERAPWTEGHELCQQNHGSLVKGCWGNDRSWVWITACEGGYGGFTRTLEDEGHHMELRGSPSCDQLSKEHSPFTPCGRPTQSLQCLTHHKTFSPLLKDHLRCGQEVSIIMLPRSFREG